MDQKYKAWTMNSNHGLEARSCEWDGAGRRVRVGELRKRGGGNSRFGRAMARRQLTIAPQVGGCRFACKIGYSDDGWQGAL